MFLNPLLVFIGGAFGTVARWLFTDVLTPVGSTGEWGLLFANILGAGLLGFFAAFFSDASPAKPDSFLHGREMLLVGTGFCGAFTSYSALAAVIGGVGQIGHSAASGAGVAGVGGSGFAGVVIAGLYFAMTLIGGAVAAWLGLRLGMVRAQRHGQGGDQQ